MKIPHWNIWNTTPFWRALNCHLLWCCKSKKDVTTAKIRSVLARLPTENKYAVYSGYIWLWASVSCTSGFVGHLHYIIHVICKIYFKTKLHFFFPTGEFHCSASWWLISTKSAVNNGLFFLAVCHRKFRQTAKGLPFLRFSWFYPGW